MDAADVWRDPLPGISPQTTELTISWAIVEIASVNPKDQISISNLSPVKLSGDEAQNWKNICAAICMSFHACINSSPLAPPAASSMGYPDSPTSYSNMAFQIGSHSAHSVSLGVSNGHIMKKHNSGSADEKIFSMLELHSNTLQGSGVPTDFVPEQIEKLLNWRSGGRVAIHSVEKTELACQVGGGLSVAPFTKIIYRIFPVLKGSGNTSAPASIPKCHAYVAVDIDPQWMVDSGASASLTGNLSLLVGTHAAHPMNFVVANGQLVPSDTCGRAFGRVKLSGIRYAPGCRKNIISAMHLVRLGCEVIFNDQGCTITKNGILIGKAPSHTDTDGLYYLDFLNDTELASICDICPHPGAQGN